MAQTIEERITELIPVLEKKSQSFIKNKDDADELFQETFMKIWSNREKYTRDESLKAWCLTIMYNTFMDSFKEAKKKVYIVEDTSDKDRDMPFTNCKDSKSISGLKEYNTVENTISVEDIYNTIDDVLSDNSNVIVKKVLEGYKRKEIGEMLKMTENSVKQSYFHGIRKVREALTIKFNLDESFANNDNLIPQHRIYSRRRFAKEIKLRKKFED